MEGIEIKNEAGNFQVNQYTRVTAYLRKGSGVLNTFQGDFSTPHVKIVYNPLTEVLAYRCSEVVSLLYTLDGYAYIGGTVSSVGSTLEYWVFGKSSNVSTEGVQVFDGAGTGVNNLLYDSSWIPIKPVGIYGNEMPTDYFGTPTEISYNLGTKSYAVVPLSVFCNIDKEVSRSSGTTDEVDVFYYRTDHGTKLTGNTLTIKKNDVERFIKFYVGVSWSSSYEYAYFKDNSAQTQYMVIDVSDL